MSRTKLFYALLFALLLGLGLRASPARADGPCSSSTFPEFLQDPENAEELANEIADCQALVDLYNSTAGANWTTPWPLEGYHCSWPGVNCRHYDYLNGEWGRVYELFLSSKNLNGNLPATLGNLTELYTLYLYDNQLSGPIPAEIGNLTKLFSFKIHNNQLSGSIPSELGNLTGLRTLTLDNNQLSGPVPPGLSNIGDEFFTKLDLSHNQLSGSIPPQLGNMTKLEVLDLSHNQLSGSIPPELSNLINLGSLYLAHNQLSGSISSQFGQLTSLVELDLAYNQDLTGPLPLTLTNIPSFDSLDIDETNLCAPQDEVFQTKFPWVGHPCILRIEPAGLNFTAVAGGDNPPAQNFNIFNGIRGSYDDNYCTSWGAYGYVMTIAHGNEWLGYELWAGDACKAILTATVNIASMSPGVYYGNFNVVGNGPLDTPQNLDVTLTLQLPSISPITGGEITANNGAITMQFPGGAVTTTTTILVSTVATTTHSLANFRFAGRLFDINATDAYGQPVTQFKQPYTLTLKYDDADWQNAGIADESDLNLYYWNGSAWVGILPCAGCSLDTANNKLTVVLDHLTEFALLALASGGEKKVYLPLIIK
jgi:hypothetical protein